MWQIFYIRAQELARERAREAELDRMSRQGAGAGRARPWLDDVRRAGSLAAGRLRSRKAAPVA